jgi:hypothetical protein
MPGRGFSNCGSVTPTDRAGIEDSVNTTATAHHKDRARTTRAHRVNLARAGVRILLVLVCILSMAAYSCTRDPSPTASYDRNRDGRVDEWEYKLGDGTVKIAVDTNAHGRPDLIRTYRDGQLLKVERDRNLDGKTDLVEEYDHGELTRLTRDDNFDGKPETIKTYRHGKLALVESDPDACGSVDRTDYFDDSGKLIRTELRKR